MIKTEASVNDVSTVMLIAFLSLFAWVNEKMGNFRSKTQFQFQNLNYFYPSIKKYLLPWK